jgi:fluoroquinolone resistance protein
MNKDFYERRFERLDFSRDGFTTGSYDACTFIHCDFSSVALNECRFTDCRFEDCNLSLITVIETSFSDVTFHQCKMLGIHFEQCHKFNLSFSATESVLNHSSWYGRSIKNTRFKDCKLIDVDFAEANLTGCLFENCDFQGAMFDATNLEKADLSTSYNIGIHPLDNKIKKAKFSSIEALRMLEYFDIQVVK